MSAIAGSFFSQSQNTGLFSYTSSTQQTAYSDQAEAAKVRVLPKDIVDWSEKGKESKAEKSGVFSSAADAIKKSRTDFQKAIERLSNVEPVAAVELSDEEAGAIKERASQLGLPTFNGDDDIFLRMDDKEYQFKPDGTVMMSQAGTPRSEKEKEYLLSLYQSLAEGKEWNPTRYGYSSD